MSTTAAAKVNAQIFRKVVPMLKTANIMLFVVNHITDDVSINPMMKKKAQLSYLKVGETLPGGKTPVYLSNLLIRFDDNSKMKDTEGFGINGTLVDLTLLKSRTSNSGNSMTLVFDYKKGFDADLSLFNLLKDLKMVNGAGAYLYLGDRSDMKFSQKQFKAKLQENEEFQKVFLETALQALQTIINDPGEPEEYKESNRYSATDAILSAIMPNVA